MKEKNGRKQWKKPKLKEVKLDKEKYVYGQCEKASAIAGCPGFLYYT